MKKLAAIVAVATVSLVGVSSRADAKAPRTVVCYQSSPGGSCRQPVSVDPPQRLDMILAPRSSGLSYREDCDQSAGRLDSYVVKVRHGKFVRYICRGIDY